MQLRSTCVVVGAALGLGAGYPGLYFSSLPVFLKPISSAFQWDRAATSAVSVASLLGLCAAAPIVGSVMDRIGARRVIGTSILMFCASLYLISILPNSLVLFAATSFAIGALGIATGPSGYAFVLSHTFNRRLGLALSLAMVGGGLGAALAPVAAQMLMASSDWRHAYRGLSLMALVSGGIAFALISVGSSAARGEQIRDREHDAAQMGDSLGQAVRSRLFWTLLIAAVLVAASGLGASVHLSAMLNDWGISRALAAQVTAAIGIGIMVGRLVSGALMDIVFAPLVGAALLLPGAVGLALLAQGPVKTLPPLISALLLGLSVGTEADFLAFVTRRYFGVKAFGAIYGCLFAAFCLGGVIGPILFGVTFDTTASYAWALRFGAAGFAGAAFAVLTLGPYRYATGARA